MQFTQPDLCDIRNGVLEKYEKTAISPIALFRYPVGSAGLEALGYESSLLDRLHPVARESYCGVGNPFRLGTIPPGARVLDFGCGAGVDALIAALLSGAEGHGGPSGLCKSGAEVHGVDISPHMLSKARSNALACAVGNVRFHHVESDELPYEDGSFDIVLSNGALNLVVDKDSVLQEIARVLRPGGELWVADQFMRDGVLNMAADAVCSWQH